jgi:hypothetical protein
MFKQTGSIVNHNIFEGIIFLWYFFAKKTILTCTSITLANQGVGAPYK